MQYEEEEDRDLSGRDEDRAPGIIEQVVREYQKQLHTPELITHVWRNLWQVWGARVGFNIHVPPVDRSEKELAETEQKDNMLIFLPEEFASDKTLSILGEVFPHIIGNWRNGFVVNTYERAGWIDIESGIDSPNGNMTEIEAIDLFISKKRKGQRLNTYIIGAQASKIFSGHYFDSGRTRSWLMGTRSILEIMNGLFESRTDNDPVCGGFYEKGSSFFEKADRLSNAPPACKPNERNPKVGWRSEGTRFS